MTVDVAQGGHVTVDVVDVTVEVDKKVAVYCGLYQVFWPPRKGILGMNVIGTVIDVKIQVVGV